MSEFGPLKATFDANVKLGFADNDITIKPNLFVEGSVNDNDDCFRAGVRRRSVFGCEDGTGQEDQDAINVNEMFQDDGTLTIVAIKKIDMDESNQTTVKFIFNGESKEEKKDKNNLYVDANEISENFAIKINIPAGDSSLDLQLGRSESVRDVGSNKNCAAYSLGDFEYAVMLNGKNDACDGNFRVGIVSKINIDQGVVSGNNKRRLVAETSVLADGNCYKISGGLDTTRLGKGWNININNESEVDGTTYKLGIQLLEDSSDANDGDETDVAINGELECITKTANNCECYYKACIEKADGHANPNSDSTKVSNSDVVTTLEMGVRKTYDKVDFAALA